MKRSGSVSGAVSLVMIFCVLCLAVFAVLTLATADREAKLARLTAQSAADYYEADRQAVEILTGLAAGEEPSVDVAYSMATDGDGTYIEFLLPAGETKSLDVAVWLTDSGWDVLRWRSVYTADWETDDTIELWDGF